MKLLLPLLLLWTRVQAKEMRFCSIETDTRVERSLLHHATREVSKISPFQVSYVGRCGAQWTHRANDRISTINIGPLRTGGATYTYFANPEYPDITLDPDKLPNAYTLYNTILHELLHAVGLHHPEPWDPNSMIGYKLRTYGLSDIVIPDERYETYRFNDLYYLQQKYGRYDFSPIEKLEIPNYPGDNTGAHRVP